MCVKQWWARIAPVVEIFTEIKLEIIGCQDFNDNDDDDLQHETHLMGSDGSALWAS